MATIQDKDDGVNLLGSSSDGSDASRFQHLMEHIQDAIVEFELIEGEPIVRGVNPSFVEVFGYEAAEITGESLNEYIVPTWLESEAQLFDQRTDIGETNYQTVQRETATGLRSFLYRGIPYDSKDGTRCGFAIYTDLTERIRNQSRIEVFNRLLRHNLRNKVNIIAGHSTQLTTQTQSTDGQTGDSTAILNSTVDELEELTNKASDVARTLNEPIPPEPAIDCVPVLTAVADRFRTRYPDAQITVDLPATLEVAATNRLEVALGYVVENAIEHNPAQTPRVSLSTQSVTDGEWVDVRIDDDGPVIPEVERAVVTGATEITPLQHGSGLGLWTVKWTVNRFGGELMFAESTVGGNRVVLRLRRAT